MNLAPQDPVTGGGLSPIYLLYNAKLTLISCTLTDNQGTNVGPAERTRLICRPRWC